MSPRFDAALRGRTDLDQYGANARILFALELGSHIDDIHSVAATCLTDGPGDKKCDLVYVSRDEQALVVAQGYEAEETTRPAAPSSKAADLNTAVGWLFSRKLQELPERIRSAAAEVHSALRDGEIRRVRLWYVHNLPESRNVAEELATVEQTARGALASAFPDSRVDEVTALEVGRETLESWYEALEAPILVTDELEVDVQGGYAIAGDRWRAFVTTVPARWLHDLHHDYKPQLFSANVRDYLGSRRSDKNINHGIQRTAKTSPSNFWVFNNGVTGITNELSYDERKGRLVLHGLSIVNGAQTTGALASLSTPPPAEALVPARFVVCGDRETIDGIILYNNSQNKVEAPDFRSNDGVQRRLRSEFEHIPASTYTGGRRGGHDRAIRRPPNLIPSTTCAQALVAFHQDPGTAYHRKSAIWESDSLYGRYFNEHTTAKHLVFCFSLARAISETKLELARRLERDGKLPEDQEKQFRYLRKRGAIYLLAAAIGKSLEIILVPWQPDFDESACLEAR